MLVVRAVNRRETIGVFVVLLSTRGCNKEEPMYFPTSVSSQGRGRSRSDEVSYITRGPFAQPFQFGVKGVKAEPGKERQRPNKVMYTAGVACWRRKRAQESTARTVRAKITRDERIEVFSSSATGVAASTYIHRNTGIPFTQRSETGEC